MAWTTKPIYWNVKPDDISDGSKPIKPTLTINEDGPLPAGDYTIGDEIIIVNDANKPVSVWPNTVDVVALPDNFSTAGWDGLITLPIKERKNKVPTHDPYTNPNAHIYYSCDCGQILDPGTKRFAELNNAAMDNGWKVRWGHEYYEPFCPKCVKDKGIE